MDGELNYSVSVAGLDDWPGVRLVPAHQRQPSLLPIDAAFPASGETGSGKRTKQSVYQSGQPETEERPARPRGKKQRFNERQTRLRNTELGAYVDAYCTENALKLSSANEVRSTLAHVSRMRGIVFVKGLGDELLLEFRDYLLGLIGEDEMVAATANKHLRNLRAIAGYAAVDSLVRPPRFKKFLPTPKPRPYAWTPEQYGEIGKASRSVNGCVGKVAANIWWPAWWYTLSRAGCRLAVMMLAARHDYDATAGEGGVIWLRAEHQKQDRDQRIALPPYVKPFLQDLLDAHDEPLLFPWPYDQPKDGERSCWKTLFKHFQQKLLDPCGIKLPKGVKTRMCRRTVATVVNELGGNATKVCGHSNPAITHKHYEDPSRIAVTMDTLLMPADKPATKQTTLFQTEDKR